MALFDDTYIIPLINQVLAKVKVIIISSCIALAHVAIKRLDVLNAKETKSAKLREFISTFRLLLYDISYAR